MEETVVYKYNNRKIRKYLSIPDFLWLIGTSQLYFSTIFELQQKQITRDPAEGYLPKFEETEKYIIKNNNVSKNLEPALFKLKRDQDFSKKLLQTLENNENFDSDLFILMCKYARNINNVKKNDVIDYFISKLSNEKIINLEKNILVSCWCLDEVESDGMWKLYSKEEGIAIETTVEKVQEFIDFSSFIKDGSYKFTHRKIEYLKNKEYEEFFGALRQLVPQNEIYQEILNNMHYENAKKALKSMVDDETQDGNLYNYLFYKRKSFEFEREYRFLIIPADAFPENKESVNFEDKYASIISLNDFIDKIIISPYAPLHYEEMIITTLEKIDYNLAKKVTTSDIKKFNDKLEEK